MMTRSFAKFFESHAGKGTLGVAVSALLLAWPPACAWILAALLLGWSSTHLRAAFEEIEGEDHPTPDHSIDGRSHFPVPEGRPHRASTDEMEHRPSLCGHPLRGGGSVRAPKGDADRPAGSPGEES